MAKILFLTTLVVALCSDSAFAWFGMGGKRNKNSNQQQQEGGLQTQPQQNGFRGKPQGPVPGDESIMRPRAHGTSETPVQDNLRWGCDRKLADNIANYNRHYAEHSGYWETTSFLSDVATPSSENPIVFYDSNTGKPLYTAPIGRTWGDFLAESRKHGWPSFRDAEVNWDYVRVLKNGETVSVDGTHLGHNLPDSAGNRYCINLVCIAGNPDRGDGRKRKQ